MELIEWYYNSTIRYSYCYNTFVFVSLPAISTKSAKSNLINGMKEENEVNWIDGCGWFVEWVGLLFFSIKWVMSRRLLSRLHIPFRKRSLPSFQFSWAIHCSCRKRARRQPLFSLKLINWVCFTKERVNGWLKWELMDWLLGWKPITNNPVIWRN